MVKAPRRFTKLFIFLVCLLIGVGWWKSRQSSNMTQKVSDLADSGEKISTQMEESSSANHEGEHSSERTDDSQKSIQIYIDGAVQKPGLYELKEDARIQNVIDLAGGLTDNADLYGLNPAQRVADEMKVHVLTQQEAEAMKRSGEAADLHAVETSDQKSADGARRAEEASSEGKININTADAETLQKLPSIGKSRAEAIIEARNEEPFHTVEDLKRVSGIGDKLFLRLRDRITIDQE